MTDREKMNAAPRCQHIKDNGRFCGSPALAGQPFCYNHDRVHHPPADPRKNPMAFIPHLETGQSIAIAVTNIARAVCSRQLDVQQANCIFNGMRLLKMGFEYRFPMNDGPEAHSLTEGMADALARAYAPPNVEDVANEVEEVETLGKLAANPSTSHVGHDNEEPCGAGTLARQRREATSKSDESDEVLDKIFRSPLANTPLDAPLTDKQLDYCRFVLRYGPTHPEFDDCTRRLGPEKTTRATA